MANITVWLTRRKKVVRTVLSVFIIALSIATDLTAPFGIAVLFILVVPFEKLWPRHRGQQIRRDGLGTDLAFALATPLLSLAGLIIAAVAGVVSSPGFPDSCCDQLLR